MAVQEIENDQNSLNKLPDILVEHFKSNETLSPITQLFLVKLQNHLSEELLTKERPEELILNAYENMMKRLLEISENPTAKQVEFLEFLEKNLVNTNNLQELLDLLTAEVISHRHTGPAPAA